MAGTQGPNGKPLAPKVAKTATSGNPGGAAAPRGKGADQGQFRTKPTNVKAKPAR